MAILRRLHSRLRSRLHQRLQFHGDEHVVVGELERGDVGLQRQHEGRRRFPPRHVVDLLQELSAGNRGDGALPGAQNTAFRAEFHRAGDADAG